MAVQNSLLERFSGKFRRCWKMIPRFSGSAICYPCQGLGTFRQGKRLLENWPRLRERCWIFSSETATAFLSSSDFQKYPKDPAVLKVLRVVNLLRVVFLVRQGDLLSRRTLCGHHFPGNYRDFSSQRRAPRRRKFGGRSNNTTA